MQVRAFGARVLVLSAVVFIAACATTPATPEQRKQRLDAEIAELAAEVKGLEASAAAPPRPMSAMSVTAADAEREIAKSMPVRITAQTFSKDMSGSLEITRVSGIKLQGEKLTFTLHGKAIGLKINTNPKGEREKALLKESEAALNSGFTITTVATLSVTTRRKLSMSFGRPTVKFSKPPKSQDVQNGLVDAFAKRLFSKGHYLDPVGPAIGGRPARLYDLFEDKGALVLVFEPNS